jgi:branched-chain amino acid transport system ATP-binding protein
MLESRNVSVFYGRHRALENVSVSVAQGEIVVMLGANGAGKSTFLRAIAGQIRKTDGGSVQMDGADITRMPPHDIVEAGIALVPEDRGIFADLTVQENLTLGAHPKRARSCETESRERVLTLFPKLAERRKQLVRTMSGGERQMVAMGRALMPEPQVLLLDEPSAGLAPAFVEAIFEKVEEINRHGVTIVMVEQNARRALAMSSRGYVLELGKEKVEGPGRELLKDPKVAELYLGGAARPAGDQGADSPS